MSLFSMTGFGNARVEHHGTIVNVAIRAVNHRFLDIAFRLPVTYTVWEQELARAIATIVKRGHLDVVINRTSQQESDVKLALNQPLLQNYLDITNQACQIAAIDPSQVLPQALIGLLQRREIVEGLSNEQVLGEEREALLAALFAALKDLQKMREQEGQKLTVVMLEMLQQLKAHLDKIVPQATEMAESYRTKLTARLAKLAADLDYDQQRVAQEIALYADRVDITEELDRLRGHIEQFEHFAQVNEGGKKLDFLLQEMGREINTIGSKAQSRTISSLVIEVKAILEKLREQAQNVE